MAKILFIGGPLDGQTRNVCELRDRYLVARMPGVGHAIRHGAEPPEERGASYVDDYTRRLLTDGREVFVVSGMTDEEVAARL